MHRWLFFALYQSTSAWLQAQSPVRVQCSEQTAQPKLHERMPQVTNANAGEEEGAGEEYRYNHS